MDERSYDHLTECLMTRRQHHILVLMAHGLSYEQIADRIFVSPSTVERDVSRAARKLGASNQTALGAKAYAAGILRDEHLPKRGK
ncbi:response regulator transcription factor [Glycomyces xiaoerkulensis]|uniref:response regulator transcription factor n=1 Tax=Glycomyces xiaoerkulensis TaxID=2038139 RepID=UPI000C2686B0|nr:helix-turn-helix transcriptional regulator [Glycomyces xiaoerkulensis]